MIIFDANVLVEYLTLPESDDVSMRIRGLIQSLVESRTVIGIPAPAWTELLCGAESADGSLVAQFKNRRAFRILPFDEAAALEASLIHRSAIERHRKKRGAAKGRWQEVKVDRQILAIALVHGVTTIYSNDSDIAREAGRLGLSVIKSIDIPLKPTQTEMQFSPGAEPNIGGPDPAQLTARSTESRFRRVEG